MPYAKLGGMRILPAALAALLLLPGTAGAQTFDAVGTRAAGMGGAFVAVADDASAVYWNPAALASGPFFGLLLDRTAAKSTHEDPAGDRGATRSGAIVALSTPALGVSYYRLRSSRVVTNAVAANDLLAQVGLLAPVPSRVESLVTHHTGVTLVQSLADGVSVGATLKLVRGIAATSLVPAASVDDLLENANDLVGKASNKFDADLGISAVVGTLRAGLTVRNVTNPEFDSPEGGPRLPLERQGRAGVALVSPMGWLVALDLDLNKVHASIGEVRHLAVGTEARVLPRAYARAGVRVNTAADQPGGRAPAVSLGGSFAARTSLWLDTQVTLGSSEGDRGWGVAARVAF